MTFKEAREKHLAEFDSAAADLRKIVADPGWCNVMYPPYKKALENLNDAVVNLERLNGVEITANRKP